MRNNEPSPQQPEWRTYLETLRRKRPGLMERACRNLLITMHRQGYIDLESLDDDVAAVLKVGRWRSHSDPNRPAPQLPAGTRRAVYKLTLSYAEQFLDPDEIIASILLTEKRQLAYEVARVAEDKDTTLSTLRRKVFEFLNFKAGEAVVPPDVVIGTRAAIVRRLLTEHLDFISIAKQFIHVRDAATILDHILPTNGSQGRVGGKAAGLILAQSILQRSRQNPDLGDIHVPLSYYIPSDGVLDFMEHNGLEELINLKYQPIDEVRREYPLVIRLFKSGEFPPTLHQGLRSMLERVGEAPLIVRSSSLLEDRIGHAFSGKYKSLFIANRGPLELRLKELEDAVAEVFASVFGPDPILYRTERGLLDFQEQMGVLIQSVVGHQLDGLLLPVFAGVAFSRCEMRWSPRIRRTDGMARLVLGLGTRAVDRTGDDYPVMVALKQPHLRILQQPTEAYRYSQHHVDVVNLEERHFDSVPLSDLMRKAGRAFPMRSQLFSIYRDDQILPMIGGMMQADPDELVVTFDGLLRSPFPRQLKALLDTLEEAIGEPVDIEFAHDGESFYLLQCRVLSLARSGERVRVPPNVPAADTLFTANRYVQNGRVRDIEYVVVVDPRDYERLPSTEAMRRVASCIGALNRKLPPRSFILLGPGRWGSRGDIRLGVPVSYADISRTAMLVEIARRKGSYIPDVSFGTHFFQDLVESDIAYLPLYPDDPDTLWNEEFLNGSRNALASVLPELADLEKVVRVIHVPEVTGGHRVQVVMDGDSDFAIAYLDRSVTTS